MPPSSLSISFFLLLSYAPLCLSCAPISGSGCRIPHEFFFLGESPPPSPSPKPKYPFPDSSSTPNPSPFFPTYPAAVVAFASFPANISSLDLPHAPAAKSFSKLVAATVISAVLVVGITLFCYFRRRRTLEFSDDKTFRSENSNRHAGSAIVEASSRTHKFRTSSTSSEFLYLGTLVSSRGSDTVSSLRKSDSPELRQLASLSRRSLNC